MTSTDEDRFTALYERHFDAIERYVRRRAAEVAVVDVVAEVFLVAWRRLDEMPATPLPWLYGVARRVLANELRGRDRRNRLVERVAGHSSHSEADHADAVASRMSVAAAFDRLSDDDRELLRLTAWEGLGTSGAAKALGCSTATLAMRLHRARRRLHRELAAETAPPALAVIPTLEGRR